MKLTKAIIGTALSLALLLGTVAAPVSVSAAQRKNTAKDVTAYLYSMDEKVTLECRFFEDMAGEPYINVTDYLDKIYSGKFSVSEEGNGVYEVKNPKKQTMTVDTKKDTVYFDEYEKFLEGAYRNEEKTGRPDKYIADGHYKYVGDVKGVTLNYSDYHIDITAVGGKVYFPLTTISDLFAPSYRCAVYLGGKIYFDAAMSEPYYDTKSLIENTARDKSVIDYAYNELCFVMDHFYGKPPKAVLSSTLNNNSFDQWLSCGDTLAAAIKTKLHSETLFDYFCGLAMLDSLADDGGHTMFCAGFLSLMGQYPDAEMTAQMLRIKDEPQGFEEEAVSAALNTCYAREGDRDSLSETRKKAYEKLEVIESWDSKSGKENGTLATLYRAADDTALFVFDSFSDEVTAPFKSALDLVQKQGMKNIVLDVSINGGGSTSAVLYMLYLMTGQDHIGEADVLTGNRFRETGKIDVNLDGKVDQQDEVHYDLHFAILTSRFSYSGGNAFPVLAQEKGIPVLGETSGGGTCMALRPGIPLSTFYGISGQYMMTRADGTDVDAGAAVDFTLTTTMNAGSVEAAKLYDIEVIRSDVNAYYRDPASTTQPPAPAPVPAQNNTWLPVVLIVAIVVIIAAAVTVFLIRRRRYREFE